MGLCASKKDLYNYNPPKQPQNTVRKNNPPINNNQNRSLVCCYKNCNNPRAYNGSYFVCRQHLDQERICGSALSKSFRH